MEHPRIRVEFLDFQPTMIVDRRPPVTLDFSFFASTIPETLEDMEPLLVKELIETNPAVLRIELKSSRNGLPSLFEIGFLKGLEVAGKLKKQMDTAWRRVEEREVIKANQKGVLLKMRGFGNKLRLTLKITPMSFWLKDKPKFASICYSREGLGEFGKGESPGDFLASNESLNLLKSGRNVFKLHRNDIGYLIEKGSAKKAKKVKKKKKSKKAKKGKSKVVEKDKMMQVEHVHHHGGCGHAHHQKNCQKHGVTQNSQKPEIHEVREFGVDLGKKNYPRHREYFDLRQFYKRNHPISSKTAKYYSTKVTPFKASKKANKSVEKIAEFSEAAWKPNQPGLALSPNFTNPFVTINKDGFYAHNGEEEARERADYFKMVESDEINKVRDTQIAGTGPGKGNHIHKRKAPTGPVFNFKCELCGNTNKEEIDMLECGHIFCIECILASNMTYKNCKLCSEEVKPYESGSSRTERASAQKAGNFYNHQIEAFSPSPNKNLGDGVEEGHSEDIETLKNIFTIEDTPMKENNLTNVEDSVKVISVSNMIDDVYKHFRKDGRRQKGRGQGVVHDEAQEDKESISSFGKVEVNTRPTEVGFLNFPEIRLSSKRELSFKDQYKNGQGCLKKGCGSDHSESSMALEGANNQVNETVRKPFHHHCGHQDHMETTRRAKIMKRKLVLRKRTIQCEIKNMKMGERRQPLTINRLVHTQTDLDSAINLKTTQKMDQNGVGLKSILKQKKKPIELEIKNTILEEPQDVKNDQTNPKLMKKDSKNRLKIRKKISKKNPFKLKIVHRKVSGRSSPVLDVESYKSFSVSSHRNYNFLLSPSKSENSIESAFSHPADPTRPEQNPKEL